MKKFLFFMILGIGLVFASCKKETPDPGYFAGIAAKGYYDLLLEGKYNDFVAGYNQPNRISKGYHEQLLLNARMFMEQQQEEHKGLAGIHAAGVFFQYHVSDSCRKGRFQYRI